MNPDSFEMDDRTAIHYMADEFIATKYHEAVRNVRRMLADDKGMDKDFRVWKARAEFFGAEALERGLV